MAKSRGCWVARSAVYSGLAAASAYDRRGRWIRYLRAHAYFRSSSSSFRFLAETPSAASMTFLSIVAPAKKLPPCRRPAAAHLPPCSLPWKPTCGRSTRLRCSRPTTSTSWPWPSATATSMPAIAWSAPTCAWWSTSPAAIPARDSACKTSSKRETWACSAPWRASTPPSARGSRPTPAIGSSSRSSGP